LSAPAKIALIGYGLGGSAFHAPLIDFVERLHLSAIVTANTERQEQARERYPNAQLLGSADEVWARASDFDAVVIATPNSSHVELGLAAINAGLPVVIDKPLAGSAHDAGRLITAAETAGVPLTVYQDRRWDGDFLTVKKLIADGELGEVHRFESRFERWRPQVGTGWRENPDPAEAGGALFDLGSHLIDQALQLFGPASDIHGEIAIRRSGAKVDDDTFVELRHESGTTSHLWMSAVVAQLGPRFRVLGDKAAYVKWGMDPQEDRLRAGGSPHEAAWGKEPESAYGELGSDSDHRPVPTLSGGYQRFYEQLAAMLLDGGPAPVDPADSQQVLALIDELRAN
jgi:predicted dehydrogenase